MQARKGQSRCSGSMMPLLRRTSFKVSQSLRRPVQKELGETLVGVTLGVEGEYEPADCAKNAGQVA